jgi:hypothetical protein
MAIDERARHELHRKLEEVLGAAEAATLMSHLPPVGWADVATKRDFVLLKQDLAQLEERVNMRFDMVDRRFESIYQRFDSMEARFDGKLALLEGRLYDRMAKQSRTIVFAVLGSVFTVASLVFAARLL